MDFKLVLEKLLTAFDEHNIRYALTGGFAMGLWGGSRSTVDLDFLVNKDDMKAVHNIMIDMSYERYNHTENVSQYISSMKIFGGINIIHAFRKVSLEMLQRAGTKDIFGGKLKIKTLLPEDIIGLKLQSLFNNPSREKIDIADIEVLVSLYRDLLNMELVREYFKIFEMEDLYKKIFESGEQ